MICTSIMLTTTNLHFWYVVHSCSSLFFIIRQCLLKTGARYTVLHITTFTDNWWHTPYAQHLCFMRVIEYNLISSYRSQCPSFFIFVFYLILLWVPLNLFILYMYIPLLCNVIVNAAETIYCKYNSGIKTENFHYIYIFLHERKWFSSRSVMIRKKEKKIVRDQKLILL